LAVIERSTVVDVTGFARLGIRRPSFVAVRGPVIAPSRKSLSNSFHFRSRDPLKASPFDRLDLA
jgi:hypothetical protein